MGEGRVLMGDGGGVPFFSVGTRADTNVHLSIRSFVRLFTLGLIHFPG